MSEQLDRIRRQLARDNEQPGPVRVRLLPTAAAMGIEFGMKYAGQLRMPGDSFEMSEKEAIAWIRAGRVELVLPEDES